MRSISSMTSAESGGRPRGRDCAQNLENPRRCQVITVAGFTTASASAHRDHTRETEDPERPVDAAKRWPGPGAPENGELLPEHEDLYNEARARAKRVNERAEQGRDDRKHRPPR